MQCAIRIYALCMLNTFQVAIFVMGIAMWGVKHISFSSTYITLHHTTLPQLSSLPTIQIRRYKIDLRQCDAFSLLKGMRVCVCIHFIFAFFNSTKVKLSRFSGSVTFR